MQFEVVSDPVKVNYQGFIPFCLHILSIGSECAGPRATPVSIPEKLAEEIPSAEGGWDNY